ncbi:hypothetical protein WDJ50_18330 (plasmid) [Deinococcus sp. VB142]|uniref:Lipoprotein n=1 Tax=Deinococcus sp. VB142 TaxID=3112952 RepID=A0AAU6Q852_9DEIO
MLRFLALLFALTLTSCNITAPPRDNAQWQTSTYGVDVTWRATAPSALGQTSTGHIAGYALAAPLGQSCVVDIDLTRSRYALARVAAHEYMHCAAARYLLPGIPRPDLGAHFESGSEGLAETYARAYVAACGDSLRALGWPDLAVPTCAEAPDPRAVAATIQQ